MKKNSKYWSDNGINVNQPYSLVDLNKNLLTPKEVYDILERAEHTTIEGKFNTYSQWKELQDSKEKDNSTE